MKKDTVHKIRITDFNYQLPDDKIAKYPLSERDHSKLLIYGDEEAGSSSIQSQTFNNLPNYLPNDTLLIVNNTKVIHARLIFKKESGASIEIFCLSPFIPSDYTESFAQIHSCSWVCMVGNSRRWKTGPLDMIIQIDGDSVTLKAERISAPQGEQSPTTDSIIKFTWDNSAYTFPELIEVAGKLPIPPYLNREAEDADDETYQTVYSHVEGSVAAPTAGLHFTPQLLKALEDKGIKTAHVTLHVGAGTFKPVKSEHIADHEMHNEFFSVSKDTINTLINHKGKIVVVGTTSMRTLESLYYIGKKLILNPTISARDLSVNQWEPYEEEYEEEPSASLQAIIDYLEVSGQDSLISSTRLMIVPGYTFHYPDALITNFHQPQSTLLLLVSAFAGKNWKSIYDYALSNNYRFLSYGDSSIIWKNNK
jgi:S-adenosylmethionine:tRNA ribosyltransferase-isomerase